MSPAQAQAALKKLFGKNAAWRYNERALKGEEREALCETLPTLAQRATDARAALDARYKVLLADPEYQRLKAAHHAARAEHEKALGHYSARRVTVGQVSGGGMFFHVIAEGDNWQEAIDAARAKAGK